MKRLHARLVRAFTRHADDPAAYLARVSKDCKRFPEGDLFPFVLPAMALCAWTGDRQVSRAATHAAADTLVGLARTRGEARLGSLMALNRDSALAVDMGWLALAFGTLRETAGVTRFDAQRRHLCDVLRTQLDEAPEGGALFSYPGQCYPFDTLPAVLALELDDRLTATPRSATTIARHLAWLRGSGSDPATGLPVSALATDRTTVKAGPRGCDLSLRLALLGPLDPILARESYARYVRTYWSDRLVLAGFREHPTGQDGAMDVDSGPILDGIGMAASAFGLVTTRVMGDRWRHGRLMFQLGLWDLGWRIAARTQGQRLRGATVPELGVPVDTECVTGFLFGDACLLFALGWPPSTTS